jgi:hypothetical protein
VSEGKADDGLVGLGNTGRNTGVGRWRLIGLGSVPHPRCPDRWHVVGGGSGKRGATAGGRLRELEGVVERPESSEREGGSQVLGGG